MRNPLLKMNYDGQVMAGGVLYPDDPWSLRRGARDWRRCAKDVIRSAQQDDDWAYRLMGARAALYRRAIARALLERAQQLERDAA